MKFHKQAPILKRTPGPWKVGTFGQIYSGDVQICKMFDWRNQIADAFLIASAPDMHIALSEVYNTIAMHEMNSGALIKVYHALDRAKGR